MQNLKSFLCPLVPSFLGAWKPGPSTRGQESSFQHLDKALQGFPLEGGGGWSLFLHSPLQSRRRGLRDPGALANPSKQM